MTRRHDITLLSGAILVSALGDFLALIPLALALQRRPAPGVVVAGLFIALWTPVVLLAGPPGCSWTAATRAASSSSRRWGRRSSRSRSRSPDSTAAILGLAALLGCGTAVAQPAEFALVPAVAGDGRLQHANGRVESARYLGYTLGPLLGAALAAGGGTRARCSSTPRASRSSPASSPPCDPAALRLATARRTAAARATASSSSCATGPSRSSSASRSRRCCS